MDEQKQPIRIVLTDAQRKQVLEATGKETKVLELTVEELEQRIAPLIFKY